MMGRLSFAAQMAIVLALALLVAQSVNFAFLLQAQKNVQEAQDTASIERFVLGLDNLERFQRFRERRERRNDGPNGPEGPPGGPDGPRRSFPILTETAEPTAPEGAMDDHLSAVLIAALNEAGRPAAGARVSRVERPFRERRMTFLMMSIPMEDGEWLNLSQPLPPEDRVSVRDLIFQTVLIYAGLLIAVLFVTARLSRPLNRLTREADTFRLDGKDAPLPLEGPRDVRQLTHSFERMRERLLRLFDEKDVMLGAIGHDLRTPLTSLRIRVEKVEDHALRESMGQTIDELSLLLEDILTLARDGKPGTERTIIDVGTLAGRVAGELESEAAQEIIVRTEGDLSVSGHEALLRRALRNLVQNGLRYGGNVSINVTRQGDRVVLAVEDDGPGLPAGEIERLREPFTRGEGSRNRATGGAGLGLAITDGAARAHDGRLILENRAEGGLRAAIELPAAF